MRRSCAESLTAWAAACRLGSMRQRGAPRSAAAVLSRAVASASLACKTFCSDGQLARNALSAAGGACHCSCAILHVTHCRSVPLVKYSVMKLMVWLGASCHLHAQLDNGQLNSMHLDGSCASLRNSSCSSIMVSTPCLQALHPEPVRLQAAYLPAQRQLLTA